MLLKKTVNETRLCAEEHEHYIGIIVRCLYLALLERSGLGESWRVEP